MGLTRIRAEQISDIDYKQAVRVVSLTNVTLSGGAPNSVDGVNLSANNRILVAGQTNKAQNGLYQVQTVGAGSNGTWVRTTDSNQDGEIEAGMIVMVTEGQEYADSQWKLTTNDPIIVGTSQLVFVPTFGSNQFGVSNLDYTGDGSTTVFLITAGQTVSSMLVFLNGVAQVPVTDYIVSAGNLTFNTAPGNGVEVMIREFSPGAGLTGNVIIGSSANNTLTVNSVISSNLVPAANTVYNLGSSTLYWKDLYLAGNSIYLGNLTIKDVGGGQIGFFENDGTTPAVIDAASLDASAIADGTSNVTVAPSANVTIGVTGNNIATISATGLIVAGSIEATNGFVGLDATKISDGTSEMAIIASGGNIRANVGGATIQTISGNGIDVTGYVTATGNVTGGNIITTGLIVATGNVTGGNMDTTGTITTGSMTATGNVTGGNLKTTSVTIGNGPISGVTTISASGNANVGNIGADAAVFTSVSGDGSALTNLNATNIASGTLSQSRLANANVVVNGVTAELGSSVTVTANTTQALTAGSYLTSTGTFNGGTARTFAVDATEAATGSKVVARDSNGNISATAVTLTSITNGNGNGVGNIGSSTTYFNTVFAKATSAQYADLAELYLADQDYPMGTVLVFGGHNEVTQSQITHTTAIAGTVSDKPAYVMNSGLQGDHVVTVALMGRVPCRVIGTIQKGDLLAASDHSGVATKLVKELYEPGCVIGKALENYDSQNEGMIEIVVGRL